MWRRSRVSGIWLTMAILALSWFPPGRVGAAGGVPQGESILAPTPEAGKTAPWAQYQGGAAHRGFTDSLLTFPLQELWRSEEGERQNSRPLIVGERVFIGRPSTRTFRALDLQTGEPLWSQSLAGYTAAIAPAYHSGQVLVPTPTAGLYSLDAETGAVRWHRKELRSLLGPAVAADGRIFITSGDDLLALDAQGRTLWQQPATAGRPALGDGAAQGLVFVAGGQGAFAFDAATGEPWWQWECSCTRVARTDVVYGAGLLLVWVYSEVPSLYALDAHSGEPIWRLDDVVGPPVVWKDVAYVPLTDYRLMRLQLPQGAVLSEWTYDWIPSIPAVHGPADYWEPVMASGVLFMGGVMAVDAETGAVRWRLGPRSFQRLFPVVGSDRLLVLGEGRLIAFAPAASAAPAHLLGTVQDAATGAAIPGAWVQLAAGPYWTAAGPEGRFSLRFPAGSRTAVVTAPGYAPRRISLNLAPGERRSEIIALEPAARQPLAGRVIDAQLGVPVPGATVTLPHLSAHLPVRTDAQGAFRLEVEAGLHTVRVAAPHYRTRLIELETTAAGAAAEVPLELVSLASPDAWTAAGGTPSGNPALAWGGAPPLQRTWSTESLRMARNSAPIAAEGRAYLVTDEGGLKALDLATGAVLWERPTSVRGTPAYDRSTLYVREGDSTLLALDAATGEVRWTAGAGRLFGPLMAENGRVMLWCETALCAYDGETGQLLWSFTADPRHASVALAGEILYISESDYVAAIRAATREPLWYQEELGLGSQLLSVQGLVVRIRHDVSGEVQVLDGATGAIRWRHELGGPDPTRAVVAGGALYLRTGPETVEKRRLEDGELLGTFSLRGELVGAGDYLYGADLTALHLPTGAITQAAGPGAEGLQPVAVAENRILALDPDRGLHVYTASAAAPPPGVLRGDVLAGEERPLTLQEGSETSPGETGSAGGPGVGADAGPGADSAAASNVDAVSDLGRPPYSVLWSSTQWAAGTAPVIAHGMVMGMDRRGHLWAQDLQTGRPVWWRAREERPHRIGLPRIDLTHGEGLLFAAYDSGRVQALDARTGERRWALQGPAGRPAVLYHDGALYVAFSQHLVALEAQSGDLRWAKRVPSSIFSLAAGGGRLYLSGPWLQALNLDDGEELWSTHLPQFGTDYLAYAEETLLVGVGSGVSVRDAATGEQLWATAAAGLAVQDGVVYAGTVSASGLHALDLHTGEELWSVPVQLHDPVVHGNLLIGSGGVTVDRQSRAVLQEAMDGRGRPIAGSGFLVLYDPGWPDDRYGRVTVLKGNGAGALHEAGGEQGQ